MIETVTVGRKLFRLDNLKKFAACELAMERAGMLEEAAAIRRKATTLALEPGLLESLLEEASRDRKESREQAFRERWMSVAVALGQSWHKRIGALYQSKRAEVVYGCGGQEVVDFDAYGKRGYINQHTGRKQPAKWRNAGAALDGANRRKARIVLQNHLGKTVATLPIPPDGAVFEKEKMVQGDLFCIRRYRGNAVIYVRYGPVFDGKSIHVKSYEITGYAVRCPDGSFELGSSIFLCRQLYLARIEAADKIRTDCTVKSV